MFSKFDMISLHVIHTSTMLATGNENGIFIPKFARVATLDFVCGCCCVVGFEFEPEFEALFELLLFSAFFTLTVLEAKLVIVLPCNLLHCLLPSAP